MRRKTEVINGIRVRRPKNEPEATFFDYATQQGWVATKRGWPDFICYKDGRVLLVEVKQKTGLALREEQAKLLQYLISAGIPCACWSPESGLYHPLTKEPL